MGYLVIEDVHKKNFESNLVVSILGSDKSCNYKSKVRVSGLVKANVTVSPGFSSMDLKIIEDNFLGMTSFKLFLPQMRGFDNEIFATTLMKHLGHLSPNTFWKEVTINGEKQLFLIQEEINSDFLMNNLLREGPIIEANNRLALEGEGFTPNTAMFAKVVNGKWLSTNSNNIKISQFAIEKLNRLNIFRPNNYRYSLNLASLSNENKRIFNEFAILMNSLNGLEALNWDDRKFYFEPVTEILYPIYYDGVSGVLPISSKSNSSESYNLYTDYPIHHENNLTSNLQLKTINELIKKIQDLQYEDFLYDLQARGLDTESFNFDEVVTLPTNAICLASNKINKIQGLYFQTRKNHLNKCSYLKNYEIKVKLIRDDDGGSSDGCELKVDNIRKVSSTLINKLNPFLAQTKILIYKNHFVINLRYSLLVFN